MFRRLVSVLLLAVTFSSNAATTISQSEQLAGKISGTDGRQIQLQIRFDEPVQPGQEFTVYVGDVPAAIVRNKSIPQIFSFSARFRVRLDEAVKVLREVGGIAQETIFKPKVTVDYKVPEGDVFEPQVRTTIANSELTNIYGVEIGDCMALVLGISNTEVKKLSRVSIATNDGELEIATTHLISTNPFFAIGAGRGFKSCEAKAE
jgi:hypothetical protein